MRIAFMGSPDFAVPALRALHRDGHIIAAVYCQPARPAGRGQAVRRCPVHVIADELGLPVRTPARLRSDTGTQAQFAALDIKQETRHFYAKYFHYVLTDGELNSILNATAP